MSFESSPLSLVMPLFGQTYSRFLGAAAITAAIFLSGCGGGGKASPPHSPPPPQQPNYGAGGGYDFSYYQPTEDLLGPLDPNPSSISLHARTFVPRARISLAIARPAAARMASLLESNNRTSYSG